MRPPIAADDILDRAAAVFARRGFRAATLAEIAGELGVTPAALYQHFASKQAILYALAYRMFDRLNEAADTVHEAVPPQRLRALLAAHAGVVAENIELVAVMSGEEAELRRIADDAMFRHGESYWERLRETYRACVTLGAVRDFDPVIAIASVYATIAGMTYWYTPGGALSATAAAELATDLALSSVSVGRMSEASEPTEAASSSTNGGG
jgi:AcrR family transcriptional regulator